MGPYSHIQSDFSPIIVILNLNTWNKICLEITMTRLPYLEQHIVTAAAYCKLDRKGIYNDVTNSNVSQQPMNSPTPNNVTITRLLPQAYGAPILIWLQIALIMNRWCKAKQIGWRSGGGGHPTHLRIAGSVYTLCCECLSEPCCLGIKSFITLYLPRASYTAKRPSEGAG